MSTADWHRDGALHFALGIEDTFVPQARPGERAIDEYELTEHYRRWHSDLALVSKAGAKLLRWGVPWYRVQPEPERWEWAWLDGIVDRLVELGIRPIIDLVHYGTPLWLDGEFDHPDYPKRVAEYSVAVADRYADRITDYTPVNEPMIHALFCGEYAYWPPYLHGDTGLVRLALQLARGFQLAQQGMREVLGDRGVFVHVDAGMRYDGDASTHGAEIARRRELVWLVEDLVTGRVNGGHPLAGWLSEQGAGDTELSSFAAAPTLPDVVGVNYYPRHSTEIFEAGAHHRGGFQDPRPTRDDGVAGLEELLRQAHDRYKTPVMVTETCVTGSVAERTAWLDESIACVARLRANGLPVVGYTWWPVFDMYEWTYRHSDRPRADHLLPMGLWALDESRDGLARVPTPLVARYRRHATDQAHGAHRR